MMKYANRDAHGTQGEEANRQVTLSFSDGTSQSIELIDPSNADDWQEEYNFDSVTTTFVRITVDTVWTTFNNGAEEIAFFNNVCGIQQFFFGLVTVIGRQLPINQAFRNPSGPNFQIKNKLKIGMKQVV